MNQYDYAYGVAYIRSIENKLLTTQDLESLVASKSPEEAMRVLSDNGYDTANVKPENFETILNKELEKTWSEAIYAMPKGANLDFLLYKNDFHNLKVALKGIRMGVKDYAKYVITPATVEFDKILRAVEKTDFASLPEMLSHIAARAYDILGRTEDAQLSDTLIDKAAMDYSLDTAKETKNDFLIGYVMLQNTLADMKIAARCAHTLKNADFMDDALSKESHFSRELMIKASLEGFESLLDFISDSGYKSCAEALANSMNEFEKLSDNMITDYMKKSTGMSFGVEPIISYINRRQTEIRNVRIIMSAKLNGFTEEQIRSRIRSFN